MWMMECSDAVDLSASESFNGGSRKLRPLIPKPTQLPSSSSCPVTNSSCFSRIHGNDLFSLQAVSEHGKRELGAHQQVSSRWNPTPEQLRTLEDLYRRGTRTPTADQIQHITAQLRSFGNIEGKNVFYWFQNHKARERQKRRRRIEDEERDLSDSSEKKQSSGLQNDQEAKSWSAPANCSTVAEESALLSRPPSDSRRSGDWIHCDSQHGSQMKHHATWQLVHLLPPYLVNATTTTTKSSSDDQGVDKQTLQLFPLHSDLSVPAEKAAQLPNSNFGPLHFYQFLPLKN